MVEIKIKTNWTQYSLKEKLFILNENIGTSEIIKIESIIMTDIKKYLFRTNEVTIEFWLVIAIMTNEEKNIALAGVGNP